VLNGKIGEWESSLPQETQAMLLDARNSTGAPAPSNRAASRAEQEAERALRRQRDELRSFPYVSTFNADYSPVSRCIPTRLISPHAGS
jgi:hypothetical protein